METVTKNPRKDYGLPFLTWSLRVLPLGSVLLYEDDDKGPIVVAKTYGGVSWSSIQSKVSKAQKIRGILNVFDSAYDHTNNKMWIHSYKQKKDRKTVP